MLYKHHNIPVNICLNATLKQIISNAPTNAQDYFPEYLYFCCLSGDTGVTSICSVLPVLSRMMTGNNIKSDLQLLPCVGLEKEAAGALLLAKREEVVENMLTFQRNNQVQMTYWYGIHGNENRTL